MSGKYNFSVLLLAVVFIILFLLERNFYLANIIIHSLVDIFAIGRSLVKVEMFLGYTVLLCVLALIRPIRTSISKLSMPTHWIISAVLVVLSYNLFLFFLFLSEFGFKVKNFIITFHYGEISSTMLLHNHLMKGFNGLFLQWFSSAHQENADTGLAFVGLLPSAWYIIGGLLVLMSAVLLLIKFIQLYNQQSKCRGLFIILYSIISFSLLKNMLDGGILSSETPVALGGLLLIFALAENKQKVYWWGLVPIIVYSLTILILWQYQFISIRYFTTTILGMVTFAMTIVALIFWQFKRQHEIRSGIVFSILALALVCIPITHSVQTYNNSRRFVTAGAIVGLYNSPVYGSKEKQQWELEERINNLDIYKVEPSTSTMIKDILLNNYLLASLDPISLPGVTCDVNNDRHEVTFNLHSIKPLDDATTQYHYGIMASAKPISYTNHLYNYKVTTSLESCAPRKLNIIQELLKAKGHETFFITNISQLNATIN